MPSPRRCSAALAATAFLAAAPALATEYQVTFNVTTPLQEVFISADEFNGSVYAWDLFPLRIPAVPVGTSTYSLGSHNLAAWAIFANSGPADVATGINSSINPPVGRTFAQVFPNYSQSVTHGNIAALCPNGAYNVQPGYALFDFVLTNEDTLKTDFPTGSLHIFIFGNGVNVGTATIAIAINGACCATDGTCTTTLVSGCAGTWTSAGVCTPNPCPQPAGACCTSAACTVSAPLACLGSYQGDATACGPAGNPTTCCPANYNGIGGLSVQDIFDFLNGWFAGAAPADFNLDGVLSVQDIFDFLNAWFAGC